MHIQRNKRKILRKKWQEILQKETFLSNITPFYPILKNEEAVDVLAGAVE